MSALDRLANMLRPQPRQGSLSGLLTSPDPVENARMNMPAEPARYGATLTNRTPDAVDGVRPMFGLPGEPLVTPERNRRDSIMAEMLTGASGGIRAFHGSPHNFDRFRTSSIGTGEGAQAYGHGLYFAGNEGVARSYRTTLSGDPTIGGRAVNWAEPAEHAASVAYAEGGRDGALRSLTREVEYLRRTKGFNESTNEIARTLRYLSEGRPLPALDPPPGRMYEVNLNADPARMLDWDAPISQQSSQVQAVARNADISSAIGITRHMVNKFRAGNEQPHDLLTGRGLHRAMSDYGERSAPAADRLREAGIPGIQYLDNGSRSAGEGTRNYVMFNDDQIEIIRKYGIAGLGMGLGAANAPYSDPAQGDTQ